MGHKKTKKRVRDDDEGVIGISTKKCIKCRSKPEVWGGHVHAQEVIVSTGFCNKCRNDNHRGAPCHEVGGGCYGSWKVWMGASLDMGWN